MGYHDPYADQKIRAGLVCIDVLSKFAVVIPIKSKDGPDVLEGTKKALEKMGKKLCRISGIFHYPQFFL